MLSAVGVGAVDNSYKVINDWLSFENPIEPLAYLSSKSAAQLRKELL